jgi:hypothetical protein
VRWDVTDYYEDKQALRKAVEKRLGLLSDKDWEIATLDPIPVNECSFSGNPDNVDADRMS